MKLVLQRVSQAQAAVEGEIVGRIGAGLVILVGLARSDTVTTLQRATDQVVHLRIFPDGQGKMNRSALEIQAELLIVPQFTLLASTAQGRRPDFTAAMEASLARELFVQWIGQLAATGLKVAQGRFQTHMQVTLVNDGPVTLVLEIS